MVLDLNIPSKLFHLLHLIDGRIDSQDITKKISNPSPKMQKGQKTNDFLNQNF